VPRGQYGSGQSRGWEGPGNKVATVVKYWGSQARARVAKAIRPRPDDIFMGTCSCTRPGAVGQGLVGVRKSE